MPRIDPSTLSYLARANGVPFYLGDAPLVALSIREACANGVREALGGRYDSGRSVAWVTENPREVA